MTRTLVSLLLAASLVACGSERGEVGQSTDFPEQPVTGAPASHDGGKSRPELREPEQGLVDIRARPFDRHRSRGKLLSLFYYSGLDECYGLDRIAVRDRRHKVVVTVFEGRHPEAEVCAEVAVAARSNVALSRPIGSRRVVDGATP